MNKEAIGETFKNQMYKWLKKVNKVNKEVNKEKFHRK